MPGRALLTRCPLETGRLELKIDTRNVSPNICPKTPSCPTASDPSRSATIRQNETWRFSSSSVSRHAQVFTRWEAPAKTMTRLTPHPKPAMLSRSLDWTSSQDQDRQKEDTKHPRKQAQVQSTSRQYPRHRSRSRRSARGGNGHQT